MGPHGFDVSDKGLSGVGLQRGRRLRGERPAPPAATLVQADNEVARGVEPTPVVARAEPRPRTAMEKERRPPVGVAGRLPIDLGAVVAT